MRRRNPLDWRTNVSRGASPSRCSRDAASSSAWPSGRRRRAAPIAGVDCFPAPTASCTCWRSTPCPAGRHGSHAGCRYRREGDRLHRGSGDWLKAATRLTRTDPRSVWFGVRRFAAPRGPVATVTNCVHNSGSTNKRAGSRASASARVARHCPSRTSFRGDAISPAHERAAAASFAGHRPETASEQEDRPGEQASHRVPERHPRKRHVMGRRHRRGQTSADGPTTPARGEIIGFLLQQSIHFLPPCPGDIFSLPGGFSACWANRASTLPPLARGE